MPKAAVDNGLVIASNRLPLRISLTEDGFDLEQTSGGLVAALGGMDPPTAWVGWPGGVVPPELEPELRERLAQNKLHPILLDHAEEEDYYGRICNDTIWPLFHYFVDRVRFSKTAWQHYVDVNERFADELAERTPPNGRVWVHDFHLTLVPEALRRRRPDLSIGFFLHIPFPASEVYRLLPAREELLLGLLGADYIGFHTSDYVHHFRTSCLRVLGIESEPDAIIHGGRIVEIGVDPIGIDVAHFRDVLTQPETAAIYADLEERYRGQSLVLGIERLDYSKGIPQKLRAFARFLEQDPTRAETTTMLQVLVPSRLESPEYQAQRDEIELEIAGINGRFGAPGRTPVEYFHRSVSPQELVALYRRADVMAVTPLRDGMNMVAQEFVLCQTAGSKKSGQARGVLLLSEFAGAAQILAGATLVNPWNTDDMVDRLGEALELTPAERRWRLSLMSGAVERLDSRRWAEGFLTHLARATRANKRVITAQPLDRVARERLCNRAAKAPRRTLFLDYDGTLRELEAHPRLAKPTPEIMELLRSLCALPATDVHIVSGRTADELEAWFGDLQISLCAEHGYLARPAGGDWQTLRDVDLTWIPRIERLFKRVAAQIPGTHVERKLGGVAWHYRQAEPEYGAWRARELLVGVEHLLPGLPAEIVIGHRVIEVRARGVDKGAYVRHLFPDGKERSHFVLSAGDDRTDADTVEALPAGSIALHVGQAFARPEGAPLRDQFVAATPRDVRRFLREFAAAVEPTGRSEAA